MSNAGFRSSEARQPLKNTGLTKLLELLARAPSPQPGAPLDGEPPAAGTVRLEPPLPGDGRSAQAAGATAEFWRDYHRRRSMNHVALMLAARAMQASVDAGTPVDAGTRRRMRAALEEYDDVQRALRDRVQDLLSDGSA